MELGASSISPKSTTLGHGIFSSSLLQQKK